MVFFTCNNCGDTFKKNAVQRHVYKCRGMSTVSCMDCNRDFDLHSYNSHNECIKEDEKYGGVNYQKKENVDKGVKKQALWVEKLQEASKSANVSPKIRNYLDIILQFDNIPRKRTKFANFVRNSIKVINTAAIDELWKIFESTMKSDKNGIESPATENAEKRSCDENENDVSSKKVKQEEVEETAEEAVAESNENGESKSESKLNYVKWAKRKLKETNDCKMKRKKFVKEAVEWFNSIESKDLTEEQFIEKMFRKLDRNGKFVVSEKHVQLGRVNAD